METFQHRIARDLSTVEAYGSYACANFKHKVHDMMCQTTDLNDPEQTTRMIFKLVAEQGMLDGPGLFEQAYANHAGTERTPEVGLDFRNGKDAKRLSARKTIEKRDTKSGSKEITRLRAVAKDVKKPGGLVISIDVSDHGLISRDGHPVTNVHLDVPPEEYQKKIWSKKKGDYVTQGSYTIDINQYGEPCGTRAKFHQKSFDELCGK